MLTTSPASRPATGLGSRTMPGPRGRLLQQQHGSRIAHLRDSALAHGRAAVRQHYGDLKGLASRQQEPRLAMAIQPAPRARPAQQSIGAAGANSVRGLGMEAPMEKGVTLVFRWQSGNTAKATLELIRKIQQARRDVRVVIITATFRAVIRKLMERFNQRLRCAKASPEGGDSPSSGLVAVFMLMRICKSVHLYGYGASASAGRKVPYHYFTNMQERTWSTKASIHSFNSEQNLLERLSTEGYIAMCNDQGSRGCSKP
mmetsp:Transcript_34487/g.97711  ORF Transcript_34487/g.97711 Transcript_34487/m.97711 type:complete len:258 (+) Transcript_34487:228-1001(+)